MNYELFNRRSTKIGINKITPKKPSETQYINMPFLKKMMNLFHTDF